MYHSSLPQIENTLPTQQLVATLQAERNAVWSMYCKIAQMQPMFANSEKVRPVLSEFSQLLIDYISLGHFGIYEHLLTKKQQQFALLSYANKLYPEFSSTTASAIIFNDAYDDGKRKFSTEHLAEDLSVLGEHLAKRMDLEDRLCSMLLH